MYNVIIVDDQPIIRNGIKSLINDLDKEWNVIGEYANGQEVLDNIDKLKVDLIITDIKMPIIDGLELVKRIRANSDTWIIIISSYNDFNYAKKAMTYKVFDFLTKPIDTEEFREALLRVKQEIRKNFDWKLLEITQENFKMYLEKYFQKQSEKFDLLEKFDNKISNDLMKFIVISIAYRGENDSVFQQQDLSVVFEGLLDKCYFVNKGINEYYIICCISKYKQFDFNELEISLLKYVKGLECKDFAMGISELNRGKQNLIRACQQAYVARKQELYNERGEIYKYVTLKDANEDVIFEILEKIIFYVFNLEMSQIIICLDELFDEIIKLKPYFSVLNKLINKLNSQIVNKIKLLDICTKVDDVKLIDMNCLDECYRIEDVFLLIKETVLDMYNILNINLDKYENHAVNLALTYINENYNKAISLGEVAGMVSLNASYLSSCFKKQKGVSFIEYITRLRIEKAKQLLVSTQMKMYNISDKIGYEDVKYFCKVFKNETGLTASNYRKLKAVIVNNKEIDN